MSLHEEALDTLKGIYEKLIEAPDKPLGYDYNNWVKNMEEEPWVNEPIIKVFQYMKKKGWIEYTADKTQCPMNITITPAGVDLIERVNTLPPVSQYNFFINNWISYDFISIENKVTNNITNPIEQQEILQQLQVLRDVIDNNQPLPKGALAKLSAHMQKHSWLYSAVTSAILNYLIGYK